MSSYYLTIKGKQYDRALYDQALQAVQGQGDGRISKPDAEKLLSKVLDAAPGQEDDYTQVEKDTVKLLRQEFNWTPQADQHFRSAVASVAALKGWQTRLAGAGTATEVPPTSAPLEVAATVTRVLDDMGLSQLQVKIPSSEVLGQVSDFGGSVGFEAALRAALKSFVEDGTDLESPHEILINEDMADPGTPELEALVRNHINRPTTTLSLVHSGPFDRDDPNMPYPPENGESVTDNWAFLLRIESLSDHLHWAIVDRQGEREPYNYGFN